MSKLIDLTGQRFGKLTVAGYAGSSKWSCVCDCGATTVVRRSNLIRGQTTSCGCARYGHSDPSGFIGMQFGKLLVEEIIYGESHIKCRCSCLCGNETVQTLSQLRRGAVVSCGCHKREASSERMKKYNSTKSKVRAGEKYGRLTALERSDKVANGGAKWICQCDCGTTCYVSTKHLIDGGVKSCGCLLKESYAKNIVRAQSKNSVHNRRKQYEALHGKISKDKYILSLDGDVFNLEDNNLMAVDRRTYNNLCRHGLLGYGEITRTAALADELNRRVNKIMKG